VDVVRSHTVAVVRVAGHLTGPGYRRVADTLGWLSEAGVRDVTVYVDVPGGIDAAGLQLLRAARGRFAAAGGALAVDSIRPGIRAALEWTGLAEEAAV
jgi:anti-anti-sigma regulatory factor